MPKNVDIKVVTDFDTNNYENFKKHEGKNILNTIEVPIEIENSINHLVSGNFVGIFTKQSNRILFQIRFYLDYSISNLFKDAEDFMATLSERRSPVEKSEMNSIRTDIIENISTESIYS